MSRPNPIGGSDGVNWTNSRSPQGSAEMLYRLAQCDFLVDSRAHIVVDSKICEDCSTHACVYACPAKLFELKTDGGILFNYEKCFECGTCYVVCNNEGAIKWSYPTGGMGVIFHYG